MKLREADNLSAVIVRKARAADVPAIARLVNNFADLGEMLHRTEDELYEAIRDFYVAVASDELLGCVALSVMDYDLAEIRSLAVNPQSQGRGVGKSLVEACVNEATEIGIRRVFALTAKPLYFEKLGFVRVPRSTFPQKIWRDCRKCRFFESCIEVAVQLDILPQSTTV